MKLGIGFPESIARFRYRPRRPPDERGRLSFSRQTVLASIFIGAFGLLLLRIIQLQLIEGPRYRALSDENRIKTKILHAPRGTIYARDGSPLVINIPGFREKLEACEKGAPCVRILSKDEVLRRLSEGEELVGLEIDSLRQYVSPASSHALGFVSQVTSSELNNPSFQENGYVVGDQVGRGGVEEQYEEILRGRAGRQLIETDAEGRELRVLGKVDSTAGADIKLALDRGLQEAAFSAMAGKKGAVVASDPRTGEVLVLLSMPTFDANLFTLGDNLTLLEYKTASEILKDEVNRPLFNRAVSGTYQPGSTFKIVTGAAALDKGAITSETKIEDVGILRVGRFSFANWYFTQYGKTEGFIDIVSAIRRSNDIFFYKASEFLGLENLGEVARQFGLSEPLGIDLPNETSGLFPTEDWKKRTIGEDWYLGDTYHIGIGQGYILTTPLQVNAWTAVIANNGILCQPTIMRSEKCEVRNAKFLRQETIDLIREGMRQACDVGGTGWPLFKFKIKSAKLAEKIDERNFFLPQEATVSGQTDGWVHIPVACKTGTAEFGDPKGRTHAWFTAFAPIADPQLVVTVLVEGGGEGSSVAGPIAKKIFEEWFSR